MLISLDCSSHSKTSFKLFLNIHIQKYLFIVPLCLGEVFPAGRLVAVCVCFRSVERVAGVLCSYDLATKSWWRGCLPAVAGYYSSFRKPFNFSISFVYSISLQSTNLKTICVMLRPVFTTR